MRALDLFRGAGGWSVACQRLGIEDHGVEIMKEANATAELAGHKTAWTDVWEPEPFEGEGEIASPPCPTFSQAGKGSGRKALESVLNAIRDGAWQNLDRLREYPVSDDDDRTRLVLTPLYYAWANRPEWIALEQVPTVLPVWEAMAEELRAWGYSTWTGNLQAEQYGVPQTRKRAFLLASRRHEVAPPTPTHRWARTLSQTLEWPSDAVVNHIRGAGMTERYGPRPGRRGDQPSFTITGKARSWMVKSPGLAPRPFSIEEAALVQTFPRHFPWVGSRSKQFQLCGNAVPPLLAEAVLKAVAS